MIKFFCDRCGKELNKSYAHICYSGNNSANLCKECFEEFQNWLDTKPFCINMEEQEKVDKLEERIVNVELALGKMSNELWRLSMVLKSPKKAEKKVNKQGYNTEAIDIKEGD